MNGQGVTLSTQVGVLPYGTTNATSSAGTPPAGNVGDSSLAKPQDASSAEKQRGINANELREATENLNKVVNLYASELKFMIDDSTGIDIVKVINTDTQEVIRQMPSEETIKIAESIDRLKGLLVRQQA